MHFRRCITFVYKSEMTQIDVVPANSNGTLSATRGTTSGLHSCVGEGAENCCSDRLQYL